MLRDKGALLLLVGAPILYGFFYPWFYSTQVVQQVPVALVVHDNSAWRGKCAALCPGQSTH
jgi:ABC-2 type transport system permease protein